MLAPSPFMGCSTPLAPPQEAQWLPSILDAIVGCAVIQLDPYGHIARWNQGATRLFEYTPLEVLGRHIDLLCVASPTLCSEPPTRSLSAPPTGALRESGWRVAKSGRRLWVESSLNPIHTEDGQLLGFVQVVNDATEQLESLRQQEARLRLIFETTHDGTFLTDDCGVILDANPMAESQSGRSRADLIGTNLVSIVPLKRRLSQLKALTLNTNGPVSVAPNEEVTCRRGDGTSFPAEVNITAALLGERPVRIVALRDVSERKVAQAERERLLRLVESASDFIGLADPEGNIVYQNAAANKALGLAENADLRGIHVSDLHPPWAVTQILEHALPAALRNGSYAHETALLSRDGSEVPVSQVITVHRNDAGEVEYTSAIMRDLRGQRKAEALLAKVASQVRGMLYQIEMTASGGLQFHYASPGAFELYGVTPESLTQNADLLSQQILPEDREQLALSVQVSAENLSPWAVEYRVRDRNGAIRWHRGRSIPERTLEGATLWYGFITDITDEKAAADEVARRKAELEDAIAALDAGFAMYDADERLIVCNNRYAELYHVTEKVRNSRARYEEVIQSGFEQFPEFLKFLPNAWTQAQWTAARLAEFRNPQGMSLQKHGDSWIRVDERKTASGGTVCTRTDITPIKQAEFRAQLQEERLKLATAAAGIGIWELEVASNALSCDPRMLELHEWHVQEFPGTYAAWRQRIHPEDLVEFEGKLQKAITHGEDFRAAFRIPRRDGTMKHIESRSSCIEGPDGSILRVIGVASDITEQIEFQDTLKRAADAAQAASKAKAEFLATMSHEIRTPMNGVIGMTNLLIGTPLDAAQHEYVETIRASGESLLTLVNDILDFSKMEAGKLILERVPFSLEQSVMESIPLFTNQAESKGIKLAYQLPTCATAVVGDPTRFKQILLNLLSNALKFTSVGSVTVSLQVSQTTESGASVELRVTDTGIGISENHLARLGESFLQADASTTRQYGGTGLGLSICRSLVQLMNGELSISSELGRGTTFAVQLPFELQRAANAETSKATPSVPTPPSAITVRRVLVAEDNPVNQRVVTLMLKKLSIEVDLAQDGCEALSLFTTRSYDCVLMDGQMPEMDGLEATRQIRRLEQREGRPRTPIVALTANALPGDRELFLAAGMDEYLTKPIRSGDLIATLSRVRVKN